ncbi:flagellar biosynthesis protein FlgN [Pontibaca salina]|uniref:Flagellar biosynthesis protein FlgN n=1 Tax=Pontibaca salina TaxID=2795731 RepID=A0A934HM06_9RHOB|nr:flagellar biosynthesis protein FlgN [Pontibaca salina]MBI6629371.1 flagellar biosynthesis protein FlgN [Pontibaca salina]
MTKESFDTLIEKLSLLLDHEHAALLAGGLGQLDSILQQKTALVDALGTFGDSERHRLAPVKQKAERNQVLFDSAMEGVRAVAKRMAILRSVRTGLATYDRSGRRADYSAGKQSSIETRV